MDSTVNTENLDKLTQTEQSLFFNQPSANINAKLWGKVACWSLENAVAITFSKNPAIVTWDNIRQYTDSPFVQKFRDLFLLIKRAKGAGQLRDPLLPIEFIEWTKRNDIDFPKEIEDEVIKYAEKNINWEEEYEKSIKQNEEIKTIYEKLHKEYQKKDILHNQRQETLQEYCKLLGDYKNERVRYFKYIKELINENKELKSNINIQTEKKNNTKEKNSMLKIIVGMAIGGYKYNPTLERQECPVIKEIVDDLLNLGIPLHRQTIEKYIKEGCELIDSDTLNNL